MTGSQRILTIAERDGRGGGGSKQSAMGSRAAAAKHGNVQQRSGAANGGVGGHATVLPVGEPGWGQHHNGELAPVPHV